MPWRIKRRLILAACGFFAFGIALAVWVRNDLLDTDLLAVVGILGGIAIIVTNLPENGNGKEK
jgi:peptidoglycan/LPS O-acetylase OafA/YrhL